MKDDTTDYNASIMKEITFKKERVTVYNINIRQKLQSVCLSFQQKSQ